MAAQTRDHLRGIGARAHLLDSDHSAGGPHPVNVQRMKLHTAPLSFGIGRLTHGHKVWFLGQLIRVQPFPLPHIVDHWITQRSAMRRGDGFAVVSLFVLVGVTLGTRIQRRLHRLEIFSLMLRMAVNASDARIGVRFRDGSDES